MFELIAYLFKLGFPLTAVTWWLFHRIYSRGQIDRSLSQAGVRASIKAMKEKYSKQQKESKKAAKEEKKSKKALQAEAIDIREAAIRAGAEKQLKFDSGEYLETNWMKFGGGFYGLTALYTFFAIELFDLLALLFDWSALAALFSQGIIDLAVDFLMNQIGNVVTAFVWFSYWPGDDDSVLLCVAIAYGAYVCGIELARREVKPDLENLEQYQSAALKQIDQTRGGIKQYQDSAKKQIELARGEIKQGIEKIRKKDEAE